jgi:hypothetical protein
MQEDEAEEVLEGGEPVAGVEEDEEGDGADVKDRRNPLAARGRGSTRHPPPGPSLVKRRPMASDMGASIAGEALGAAGGFEEIETGA